MFAFNVGAVVLTVAALVVNVVEYPLNFPAADPVGTVYTLASVILVPFFAKYVILLPDVA